MMSRPSRISWPRASRGSALTSGMVQGAGDGGCAAATKLTATSEKMLRAQSRNSMLAYSKLRRSADSLIPLLSLRPAARLLSASLFTNGFCDCATTDQGLAHNISYFAKQLPNLHNSDVVDQIFIAAGALSCIPFF